MNMPTIIGTIIIAVIFFSIIINGIRGHKKNDGGCGGNCGGCPYAGSCHRH